MNKRSEINNDLCNLGHKCLDKITVELTDKFVKDLKKGRPQAYGPDGICAEHLHYAHPARLDCALETTL